MISPEELAELLNNAFSEESMEALVELWNGGSQAFDIEHPEIEPALKEVAEALKEYYDSYYDPYENDY